MGCISFQILLVLVLDVILASGNEIRVFINGTAPIHTVNSMSPSYAAGMGLFRNERYKNLSDPKLLTLTKALGPSYLRLGGTKSDHAHFIPESHYDDFDEYHFDGALVNKQKYVQHEKNMREALEMHQDRDLSNQKAVFKNTTYTGEMFDALMKFVDDSNYNLIFGLNLLDRTNNSWNPNNSLQLLAYAKQKKYRIDWELGNEPNSYNHKIGHRIEAKTVAKAFRQLTSILRSDSWWRQSKIIGPDTNAMTRKFSLQFFSKFLHYVGRKVYAATFHHYYLDSKGATIHNFTDPILLDKIKHQFKDIVQIQQQQPKFVPLWIGETSSSYGGGAKGLSDTYVAGFMWLDKLGLSAARGIDMVIRQTLLESNYAMIDSSFNPNPDYWLTLLYKTLVGTRVLEVSEKRHNSDSDHSIRIYAHCTNTKRTTYKPGTITIYYLNLSTRNRTFAVTSRIKVAHAYILTSSTKELNSTFVRLNGKELHMVDDHTLPILKPEVINIREGGIIKFPTMSFGFIVLPDLRVRACL